MRMKQLLLPVLVLLLIPSQAKLFGCATETCLYNGTTEKWNCEYLGCPKQPEWVQNITQINTTHITVVNCSEQDILDQFYLSFDAYTERIDRRFNWTQTVQEQQEALDACKRDLGYCVRDSAQTSQFYVNRTELDSCKLMLGNANQELADAQRQLGMRLFMGAAIGAGLVWFFMVRKDEVRTSEVTPTPGDLAFNPKEIDRDVDMARLKAETRMLKERLNELLPKRPESKKQ